MKHIFRGELAHIMKAVRAPWVPLLWLGLLAWGMAVLGPPASWLASVLGALLVIVVAVDMRTMTIPNLLTLLLALLGVAVAADWQMACAGLVVGYGVFQAVALGGRFLLGRDGLGQGDVKLYGALGAWVGLTGLPLVALVASWAALGYIVAMRHPRGARLPFGPFLAAGGWLVYVYQGVIWDALAGFSGNAAGL